MGDFDILLTKTFGGDKFMFKAELQSSNKKYNLPKITPNTPTFIFTISVIASENQAINKERQ